MIEINTNINDDDEERGIAGAFGVDPLTAAAHEAPVGHDDVFAEEGQRGNIEGMKVYAGAGLFYAEGVEDALIEAVISIVAEMGCVWSLDDLDPDPVATAAGCEWYREFSDDKGDVLATLAVGYDTEYGLYRLAVVNEEAKRVFSVTGLNGPGDAVWLLSDVFRFSQA